MGLHKNLRFSLIAFVQQFIQDAAGISPELAFIDFDANPRLNSLPEVDLAGMKGFSWQDNDGLAEVDVMIGITTLNDVSLMRHTDLMDRLTDLLLPERKIPVYNGDASTLEEIGWMVVSQGTDVMPIIPAEVRQVQLISVHLLTDQSTR